MRKQTERHFNVHLEHVDRFQFRSQASEGERLHGEPILSDEPDPVGDASAQATPALLATALAHCLSASLLETMRHARVDVRSLVTDATAVVALGPEGHPRIRQVDVVIQPQVPANSDRLDRCAEVFEKHCTVTASVRDGVQINVKVDWNLVPTE
jgi:uncharacterized OsmC-like protein